MSALYNAMHQKIDEDKENDVEQKTNAHNSSIECPDQENSQAEL